VLVRRNNGSARFPNHASEGGVALMAVHKGRYA